MNGECRMNLKSCKITGLAAVIIAAGMILVGCKKQEQTPAPEPTATQPPKAEPPPVEANPSSSAASKAGEAAHNYTKELLSPAKLKERAPDTYKVKFDTTRGEFNFV